MINQVHTTKDYSLFKSIDGNRNVNLMHINRLKKSMQEHYLFTSILVNEKYEIIDGQHRFSVIKDLNLPLNYIIQKGYSLDEVHRLNQNAKTWNADDYMSGYCELGYNDYIVYRDFKKKYKFGHHECQFLLKGTTSHGSDCVRAFNKGSFKVGALNEAIDCAEKIHSIKKLYKGFSRRSFIQAIAHLIKKEEFIFSEFIDKLKKQPSSLTDCTTTVQYTELIEEIYNYRRRVKVNLRY